MFPLIHEFDHGITIYSYGALISLGALLAAAYLLFQAKREFGVDPYVMNNLILVIIVMAFIGGKLLFFLEEPTKYAENPVLMLEDIGNGFVFYGSLLFALPAAYFFLRRHKLPLWPLLDILALSIAIVHFFGRLGCFSAGCCHGLVTDSRWGVVFEHPDSLAPRHVFLHPTQLYSAVMILVIGLLCFAVKTRKRFHGQVMLTYIIIYALGRSVIEEFRGDGHRGFLLNGLISHSQAISLALVLLMAWLYWRRSKLGNARLKNSRL